MRGFYFITDSGLTENGVAEDVRRALRAGVAIVQYREKSLPRKAALDEAREIVRLCREAGVPFVVNDDCALAIECGADGAHVGQGDMAADLAREMLGPDALLGVSAATPEEAEAALRAGANYIGVGAVFATSTKPDAGAPLGLEGLRRMRAATALPIAAIGGITEANAREVVSAGADMICAISASLRGGDVEANIRRLTLAAGL